MRILSIIFALLSAWLGVCAVDTMTGVYNDRVRTLQVQVDGNELAPPIISLGSDERIIIKFDHLADEREYLRYELIHCNANWQPSGLVDSEFLDGFNMGTIDDYQYSAATTVRYVNYQLTIPNKDVAPLISGNYLLKVYPEDDPDSPWLQCRFMVSENSAVIGAEVSSRTDIDFNKTHQQLAITVDTERADVADPFNELIVMVQQNGRYDNEVALRQPMRMASRRVSVYEHMPQLIFEAGNEYRRFETVSTLYPSMGVESIEYLDPYYHMTLYPDSPRGDTQYLYDQTQHGRYKVREYNAYDSDTEADYVVVHFSLDIDEMADAMIFIDGDLVNRRFDPEALMTFNRATDRYERNMLLKQGAYNYQYLVVPKGKNRGYTAPIEGDKYQTVNEYLIKVYNRHLGDRYDRLIGTYTIYSAD